MWILASSAMLVAGAVVLATVRARLGSRRIDDLWRALQSQPAPILTKGPAADLPPPVLQYLERVLPAGGELAGSVELSMRGEIRLGPDKPWMPIEAGQLLTRAEGGAFVWRARAGKGLLRMRGADLYARGRGQTRFLLAGIVPVANATGPDVARSARGRLGAEAVLLPTMLLPGAGARWEAIDADSARVWVPVDGEEIAVRMFFLPGGGLKRVELDRWNNVPPAEGFQPIPFAVRVVDEARFDGYMIPSKIRAYWWYGTDHQFSFFKATIVNARFR